MNEEYEKGQDITKALDAYFSQDRKFIDTARIPLICQDIRGIHATLQDMKDNQTWLVRLIIGAVFLGLLATLWKK